ncbi:MAG: asparagine--tRNA ligase [Oligoflexales bacterium]|nr:asparagine--tRNA ligase [Oligoflexales bacterium]
MFRRHIRHMIAKGENGQEVTVLAWVRTKRVSKNFAFISVNDGSCQALLQIVVDAGTPAFEALKDVQTGCSVRVSGELRESPAKGQKWEVLAKELVVIGEAPADTYPLQKKGHSLEFLREIAHLRPRTNTFGAVFRVRNVLAQAVHEFFRQRDFIWAHTPILTASDCEGGGEMFKVTCLDLENPPKDGQGKVDYSKDFFGKAANLTVSGQLEAEFLALSLGDVYTFGPTFRAENSHTTRHLSEFWMIEPEMAFADLQVDMDLAQSFVAYLVKQVLEKCPDELAFFEKLYKNIKVSDLEKLAGSSFVQMSYTDAVKTLQDSKKKFEYPVEWGVDLQTEHERFLTEHICKGPVTVFDYPKDIKAFYMRQNDDDKTVAAMDVLVPGVGELIGGSQREERLDLLDSKMDALGIPKADLQWYLDLRRFGSVPHAGFGMGFERMVMYVTGMQNIRDVIMCPRTPNLIDF